jgi:hypothetical protein
MKDLVPAQIDGWKSDGKDGIYDRKTLYDYIDGSAEVYLAFDFRQAFARRFVKQGQPGITLDFFDMGSSQDAYGIFTFEREGKSIGIGQDSEYASGFLRFWKGRYFVSILADRETTVVRKAVMDLGKAIAKSIPDEGKRPEILSLLPRKDLIETSIRFFHQASGLNYHYFIADKNVLNLSRETDVLLARYKEGQCKTQLIVIRYPDVQSAQSALESFRKSVIPDAKNGAVRLENGKWAVSGERGRILAIVFDGLTEETARLLVDEVLAKVEVAVK